MILIPMLVLAGSTEARFAMLARGVPIAVGQPERVWGPVRIGEGVRDALPSWNIESATRGWRLEAQVDGGPWRIWVDGAVGKPLPLDLAKASSLRVRLVPKDGKLIARMVAVATRPRVTDSSFDSAPTKAIRLTLPTSPTGGSDLGRLGSAVLDFWASQYNAASWKETPAALAAKTENTADFSQFAAGSARLGLRTYATYFRGLQDLSAWLETGAPVMIATRRGPMLPVEISPSGEVTVLLPFEDRLIPTRIPKVEFTPMWESTGRLALLLHPTALETPGEGVGPWYHPFDDK